MQKKKESPGSGLRRRGSDQALGQGTCPQAFGEFRARDHLIEVKKRVLFEARCFAHAEVAGFGTPFMLEPRPQS